MPRQIGRITTRDYQDTAHDRVFAAWEHRQRVMVVMPCRTGKTTVAASIIRTFRARTGQQAVFLADRKLLLGHDQAAGTFARAGLKIVRDYGLERPSIEQIIGADVVLSTRQSMVRRVVEWLDRGLPPFGLVIVDECHHAKAPQYRTILGCLSEAKVLGLTATPPEQLPGEEGLGGVFQTTAYELSLPDAVGMGAVVEPIIKVVPAGLDLTGLRPRGGDFTEADLAERIGTQVNRVAYRTKQFLGPWRRFILFVPGVKAAEACAGLLTDLGVPTAAISGQDSEDEQERVKQSHAEGRIRGIACADLLTEGHDAPFLGAVVLARPTMSGRLYRQMAQRGGTPFAGKKNYWLIDLCMNSDTFELAHPADLWAGPGIPEEAMEIARALINTGQATRVSEAIEKAQEWLRDRAERQRMKVAKQQESRHLYYGQARTYRPLGSKRDRVAEMKRTFQEMSRQ